MRWPAKKSTSTRNDDHTGSPVVVIAVLVHVVVGVGLWAVERYRPDQDFTALARELLGTRYTRVSVVEVSPPPPVAAVVQPEPAPVEAPPKIEQAPVKKAPAKKVRKPSLAKAPTTTTAPVSTEAPPAVTTSDGVAFQMPELGAAASKTVQAGTSDGVDTADARPGRRDGRPDGVGAVKPVSVALLSRRPVPVGDTDFVEAKKEYPPAAKRAGIEGAVHVKLLINAKGRVVKRSVIKRLGYGLDALARKLAGRLRFQPALDNRKRAVAAEIVWIFRFRVPD